MFQPTRFQKITEWFLKNCKSKEVFSLLAIMFSSSFLMNSGLRYGTMMSNVFASLEMEKLLS
jgi:hypothetical protein